MVLFEQNNMFGIFLKQKVLVLACKQQHYILYTEPGHFQKDFSCQIFHQRRGYHGLVFTHVTYNCAK